LEILEKSKRLSQIIALIKLKILNQSLIIVDWALVFYVLLIYNCKLLLKYVTIIMKEGKFNMKYRCPICGAKLQSNVICPYCKITDKQIESASNRKVKEYKAFGNTDMIHYTNIIPSDLSRLKIILYTIFFGLIGVNHYYVLRTKRGIFATVSTAGVFIITILPLVTHIGTTAGKVIYNILFEVLFFMMTFNVIMWVSDLIGVVFKTFKVPVVLGEKEKGGKK